MQDTRTEEMELVQASAALRISRERALRLVLTGRLEGTRRDGRWYCSSASVMRERERQGKR